MQTVNLSVSYGRTRALEDVTFSVPSGAIAAIIGPSGCGKTTLLTCLNALIEEQSGARVEGEVLLAGESTSGMRRDLLRRRVGMVTQTPTPFPFSVYRNLTYGPRYYHLVRKAQLDQLVREKLEMVGLYDEVRDDLHRSALALSGGQQQRLCIARALTVEPEVLLLDEPCSSLDVRATAKVEATLLDLRGAYTIIIVTHNIAQARRIADHALFLNGGRMVEMAPAKRLFEHLREVQTRDFLAGTFG